MDLTFQSNEIGEKAKYMGPEQIMDQKIVARMQLIAGTPAAAAQSLLNEYPGWFCQTPEGEYLLEVIRLGGAIHVRRFDSGAA